MLACEEHEEQRRMCMIMMSAVVPIISLDSGDESGFLGLLSIEVH